MFLLNVKNGKCKIYIIVFIAEEYSLGSHLGWQRKWRCCLFMEGWQPRTYSRDDDRSIGGNVMCKLYADDIKLYSVVNTDHDRAALQNSLNRLKDWSDTWQLQISITKCTSMNLGRADSDSFTFTLGNNDLPLETSVKDLGVTVDSNLKYAQHINNCLLYTSPSPRD